MSDEAAIRRKNLARLCKVRGWGPKELHEAMGEDGGVYSFWPNLLNNPKKSFGEKVARRIEDSLNLPRGWLDTDDDVPPLEGDSDRKKRNLAVADALNTLGPAARREALEFIRFKLVGQEELRVAEELAAYIKRDQETQKPS
jgi:hypothetical protein